MCALQERDYDEGIIPRSLHVSSFYFFGKMKCVALLRIVHCSWRDNMDGNQVEGNDELDMRY